MRKALASAALAAMLSIGIGTAAVAQTTADDPSTEVVEVEDDDNAGKIGLLGLVGLFGLAGFARRGGGGGGGGGGRRASAPRGGYTTDWSR